MSTDPRTALPADPVPPVRGRALVLGGGGSTGNAWLIGVVAGLLEVGLDVTDADLVVGTSAGSTAAAQLTGADPAALLAAALTPAAPGRTAPAGAPARPVVNHLERTAALIAAARDPADMRRRIGAGALALEADADGSSSARWRATVAARLPRQDWPDRAVLITAVDARTGEPVVLDRSSGVDLADAVAASCSSGLPYAIGEQRYVDGGYRRGENADLAAGCARVLVLSPFGGRTRMPLAWGLHLDAQVEELRAGGSQVETVGPQAGSAHLFGPRAMDPTLRPEAARAGFAQGRALVGPLGRFWR